MYGIEHGPEDQVSVSYPGPIFMMSTAQPGPELRTTESALAVTHVEPILGVNHT